MTIINELIENMIHSTDQAFVGVPLIFIYFAFIVTVALWRIWQSNKEGHH